MLQPSAPPPEPPRCDACLCLQAHLCSSFLSLRRAVVACLRQLVQREALAVSQHAVALVKELPRRDNAQLGEPPFTCLSGPTRRLTSEPGSGVSADVTLKEVGLEGALFTLLDRESDSGLRRDIQETLVHMMASSATSGKLGHWLKLCKDVLSAASGGSAHLAPPGFCHQHHMLSLSPQTLGVRWRRAGRTRRPTPAGTTTHLRSELGPSPAARSRPCAGPRAASPWTVCVAS